MFCLFFVIYIRTFISYSSDLVQFYNKMNSRRGKQDEFEIVWISRCRSVDDFGQYFTHMNWLALPPQEAMVSITFLTARVAYSNKYVNLDLSMH